MYSLANEHLNLRGDNHLCWYITWICKHVYFQSFKLVKVYNRHESGSIPTKTKGVPNEIKSIDEKDGSNGKEKDFGIGQEGKS
jgi:hypothetical protein